MQAKWGVNWINVIWDLLNFIETWHGLTTLSETFIALSIVKRPVFINSFAILPKICMVIINSGTFGLTNKKYVTLPEHFNQL